MGLCACHSGMDYGFCCEPYHLGKKAESALILMRSRYAAYSLDLPDYIIVTTSKNSPYYEKNHYRWKADIEEFSKSVDFLGLEITLFEETGDTALVSFTAKLFKGEKDVSFSEKSFFVKKEGTWLYEVGLKE